MKNDDEITLYKEDLFALSSDVRSSILKHIDKKSSTLTELSEELGLSKSTVHQHISHLISSELIEADESRKWHPYTLTPKAERILHPEKGYKIVLVIAAGIFTGLAGIISICTYFNGFSYQGAGHKYHDPVYFFAGELLIVITIFLAYRIYSSSKKG